MTMVPGALGAGAAGAGAAAGAAAWGATATADVAGGVAGGTGGLVAEAGAVLPGVRITKKLAMPTPITTVATAITASAGVFRLMATVGAAVPAAAAGSTRCVAAALTVASAGVLSTVWSAPPAGTPAS